MKNSGELHSHNRLLLPVTLGWTVTVLGITAGLRGTALALKPFLDLNDPRVGPAGFGALVVHAILCRDDRRRRVVLRTGLALEVLRLMILAWRGVAMDVLVLSVGYGFLAAVLFDFVIHREWRESALAALVPIGMACAPIGLGELVRRFTPLTYDGALLALDSTLHVPFSSWLGLVFKAHPAIAVVSLISYAALPGAIAAGLAYEEYNFRRGAERGVGVNLLLAYAVSGTIAAALYVLCPATGPAHAFSGAFPSHLPGTSGVPLSLAAFAPTSPRNAMPSLHAAWAILLARSTAGARLSVRLTAIVFAVMTVAATIGSGEHYVLDLIATAPFLVALEAATARRVISLRARLAAIVAGVVLYGAWIIAVRRAAWSVPLFVAEPVIPWLLTIVTIVVSALVALRQFPFTAAVSNPILPEHQPQRVPATRII